MTGEPKPKELDLSDPQTWRKMDRVEFQQRLSDGIKISKQGGGSYVFGITGGNLPWKDGKR